MVFVDPGMDLEEKPTRKKEVRSAGRTKSGQMKISIYGYTAKNARRFYVKITGNQLSVRFPLFLQVPVKNFQESGTVR